MLTAAKHFCKTALGLVRESDVLVTFKIARVETAALAADREMQDLFTETITEQFANKVLIDPQTVNVFLELPGVGNCIGWRGTQNCDPKSERNPDLDQSCEEVVLQSSPGYCECIAGRRVARSGCAHEAFTCEEKCSEGQEAKPKDDGDAIVKDPAIHPRTYEAEEAELFGGGTNFAVEGENPGRCTRHSGVLESFLNVESVQECAEQLSRLRQDEPEALSAEFLASRKRCQVLRGQSIPDGAPGYACFLAMDPRPEITGNRFAHGFSGKGFVAIKHPSGDMVRWTVNVPKAGRYTLDFRYSMGSPANWRGLRPVRLTINGESPAKAKAVSAEGYTLHPASYLSGYADGGQQVSIEEGVARCDELGSRCGGLTCNVQMTTCTLRAGKVAKDYAQESSLLKNPKTVSAEGYTLRPATYLSGYADGGQQVSVEEGVARCDELGSRCGGLTCNVQMTTCTLRAGKVAKEYAHESSLQKDSIGEHPAALVDEIDVRDAARQVVFTPTKGWSDWEKIPVVVDLRDGENFVMLEVTGKTYDGGFLGPSLDSLIVKPFPGGTEWRCVDVSGKRLGPVRLNRDGEVEHMSMDAKTIGDGDCDEMVVGKNWNESAIQPLVCGEGHKKAFGWWKSGYESTNHWCFQARRLLQWSTEGNAKGMEVRVVLTTDNPSQAFKIKRRVQVLYGDEIINTAIARELQSLPNIADYTLGDPSVTGLLAVEGTKPTEPHMMRTGVKNAFWNTTGALISWPCRLEECVEPSGRYVEAWGVGPLPTFGGNFIHGEKHYHSMVGNEQLRWRLRRSLGDAQSWSFHMRVEFEKRGGKKGAFVLWSDDNTNNKIVFDVHNNEASLAMTSGETKDTPLVYISGDKFWSPPNFKTVASPASGELHDISIVKRDCTIFVFIDGKEALTNIPQYWKVIGVGLLPRKTNFRLLNFGMTFEGPQVRDLSEAGPFCKMYLDKKAGFRLMRKGHLGCMKVVGADSAVQSTENMKDCTYFYFDEGVMRDVSTSKCLDYYYNSGVFGLYSCHGGWNQRFGPYREVDGKYEFMRFCLGSHECLDELDLGVCPKLKTACSCSEYSKVCGWDEAAGVCSGEKKDIGVTCGACDRQAKCAAAHVGEMQTLADKFCEQQEGGYKFARLLRASRARGGRWACYRLAGLDLTLDGMCMDTCGYPIECASGPKYSGLDAIDVHDRLMHEVMLPNVSRLCDDTNRFSTTTCGMLGWGPAGASELVCASARGQLNAKACEGKATYADAMSACKAIGARLCTVGEVERGEAALAGCSLGKHHIWAKRGDCPPGEEFALTPQKAYQMVFPGKCVGSEAKKHYVCCADAETPYIHIHPKDLSERTPLTPLTMKAATWSVWYGEAKHEMCLGIHGSKLVARKCGKGTVLFASNDHLLVPYEESSGTVVRSHKCLRVQDETIVAGACTYGRGVALRVTSELKLAVGEAQCLAYNAESTSSLAEVWLEDDETKCGQWSFGFKHQVPTQDVPQQVKDLVQNGEFNDEVLASVVDSAIEHAKEALGASVSGAFWTWLSSVDGLKQSLAATAHPIPHGTVLNLYRLWTYFGVDWEDRFSNLALAISHQGRHRNILENDVAFSDNSQQIHTSCGCDSSESCGFPLHRGHNPTGPAFIEWIERLEAANKSLWFPVDHGKRGAPWPLMNSYSTVPHDECLYGELNGFGGEYTFRYGRFEIMCKHSDWQPNSGPRISQDGGVCGRLSYLSRVAMTCSGAPSAGMGQPGHAAGWTFRMGESVEDGAAQTWDWNTDWAIYDERVSTSAWTLALTEGRHHRGNAQWLKTLAPAMSRPDGLATWERGRIAALTALQASHWGGADGSAWLRKAVEISPYDIEIWEIFRTRIEQGLVDYVQALEFWNDFKKAMVVDSSHAFHKLAEEFFYTIANMQTCSNELMTWLQHETGSLVHIWESKGFSFDMVAQRLILEIKQVECSFLLNGFNETLAIEKYYNILYGIMAESHPWRSVLNMNSRFGAAQGCVTHCVGAYVEQEEDSAKITHAVDWVLQFARPGECNMKLFGKSYFNWHQHESVDFHPSWEPLWVDWAKPLMERQGLHEKVREIEDWSSSCLNEPWKHTHNNSRGERYDGCYLGKNGDFGEVVMFMEWVVPFYHSGYNQSHDSFFPDGALAWLRKSGAALLEIRMNGTNATGDSASAAGMTDADVAELLRFTDPGSSVKDNGDWNGKQVQDCLTKHAESSNNAELDDACKHIILQVEDDVESGRELVHEKLYEPQGSELGAKQGGEFEDHEPAPRTVDQLPANLRQRFANMYDKVGSNSSYFNPFQESVAKVQ
eukprot:TRINITY_DN12590_c0_g1_i6.p1 TRINITY_DN12590_c0_g1~~TRINITY_DN12590_c0_g1_i6.p1  ORF type:complete len:2543 (-),score=356.61 TRINITY_DN12590_c0_g1_i6:132-7016(-)